MRAADASAKNGLPVELGAHGEHGAARAGESREAGPPTPSLYLTVAQFAHELQVGRSSIYRLIEREPTLPHLVLGGHTRFPRNRLFAWLQQREYSVRRPRPVEVVEADPGHVGGHTKPIGAKPSTRGVK